jgi:hypothetical protein
MTFSESIWSCSAFHSWAVMSLGYFTKLVRERGMKPDMHVRFLAFNWHVPLTYLSGHVWSISFFSLPQLFQRFARHAPVEEHRLAPDKLDGFAVSWSPSVELCK